MLLARAGEIKQTKRREKLIENAELARISKRLVMLDDNVPVQATIEEFGLRQPVADDLRAFLERYEFRSLLRRLSDQLDGAEAPAETPELPASPKEAAYDLGQELPAPERRAAAAPRPRIVAVHSETT